MINKNTMDNLLDNQLPNPLDNTLDNPLDTNKNDKNIKNEKKEIRARQQTEVKMRIITLETLKSMPNGTAFCQIDKWGNYEGGLNILTGRYEDRTGFNGIMELLPWSPDGDEYTNLHMFDDNQELIKDKDFPAEWVTTDTAHHDFEHNQLFMIFSKAEVQKMIQALQWALSGLEDGFDMDEVLK